MDLAAQLNQERVNAHGRARCRVQKNRVSAPGSATATWDAHAGELEDERAPRLREHGGAARFDARKRIWPETMACRSRGDSGSARGRGSRGRNRRTWWQQQVQQGSPGLGRGAPVRLGRPGARGTAQGRTPGHGSMARARDAMVVAAVLVARQTTAEHSEEARNGQEAGMVGEEVELGLLRDLSVGGR
ncbi:hypothetical protein CFC21_052045 [Triticum aestivum]|uniref:Uncharacterized protein n=3 Tax=Triticum TaxID=4564 RepID=A0A9R0VIM3_TRITD|nr:hypothetical protein CFC21_052045 [Triticum aestivum]VAH60909.1 unnamed protein product [Triticum turgidum subsp. durum]